MSSIPYTSPTLIYGDSFADDSPRQRWLKAAALLKTRCDLKASPEMRARSISYASHAAIPVGVLTLRAGGKDLAGAKLDELLARAVARERVEIEVDILAFEQGRKDKKGTVEKNRKGVRFKSAAMRRLGASGVGTPYMRDHDQGNSLAKSGVVTASETTDLGDGHFQIRQTILISEPAAVERAARGLLGSVSIGWEPTGPVICTACDSEVLTKCMHFPFDTVLNDDGDELEVEWEFSSAALLETSECPIGAVRNAGPDAYRALAATLSLDGTDSVPSLAITNKENSMKILGGLAAKLNLGAAATEEDVLSAVDGMMKSHETTSAKLAIAESDRVKLAAEVETYKTLERKTAEDTFIKAAIDTGRILPLDDSPWRRLFASDQAGAREDMAKRPAHCASPVGAARQSDKPDVAVDKDVTQATSVDAQLLKQGTDPDLTRLWAKKLGVKNADKHIADALGMGEVV